MSDQTDVKPPVEIIPSVERSVSAVASAHAPFLYFENAPAFGHLNGIIRVTLEASRDMPTLGPTVGNDRVIVAHLRMNIPAAHSLLEALKSALLLAAQAAGPSGKPN
jgi:hypothetical protein